MACSTGFELTALQCNFNAFIDVNCGDLDDVAVTCCKFKV